MSWDRSGNGSLLTRQERKTAGLWRQFSWEKTGDGPGNQGTVSGKRDCPRVGDFGASSVVPWCGSLSSPAKNHGLVYRGRACGRIISVCLYLMIGMTVSAFRAMVMFLFRIGADLSGRHYDSPTALAAAAVTVCMWRPLSLYDSGFWLSFGALIAII